MRSRLVTGQVPQQIAPRQTGVKITETKFSRLVTGFGPNDSPAIIVEPVVDSTPDVSAEVLNREQEIIARLEAEIRKLKRKLSAAIGEGHGGGGGVVSGPAPPVEYAPPSFLPLHPVEGDLLTYVPGTWLNADTVTHEWYLNGAPTGNTGPIFATAGLAGSIIMVRETATNHQGTQTADSVTSLIRPSAPVNTVVPSFIPADPVDGMVLTYVDGIWIDADTVTHEWFLDGLATGNTGSSFDTTGHAGSTIMVRDTATNSDGTQTADSNISMITVSALLDVVDGGIPVVDGGIQVVDS